MLVGLQLYVLLEVLVGFFGLFLELVEAAPAYYVLRLLFNVYGDGNVSERLLIGPQQAVDDSPPIEVLSEVLLSLFDGFAKGLLAFLVQGEIGFEEPIVKHHAWAGLEVRSLFNDLQYAEQNLVSRLVLLGKGGIAEGDLEKHHALVKVWLDLRSIDLDQLFELINAFLKELPLAEHERLAQQLIVPNSMVLYLFTEHRLYESLVLLVFVEPSFVAK